MREDITLVCGSPLSARLYHQLSNFYIPILSDCISYYSYVLLDIETDSTKLPCQNAVGTGVSGGVDSSYTIAKYRKYPIDAYRLTHLLYFNIGIYGNGFESSAEKGVQAKTRQIAEDTGLEYVKLTSNVCDVLYKAAHAPIVPVVFLSAAQSLQKLFSVYYYSSGVTANDFYLNEIDAANYDILSLHCSNTENMNFYSSGMETTRIDKISSIADIPFVKNNLLVCLDITEDAQNCSRCAKCTRTMSSLEALGKLDDFGNVFDVDGFRNDTGYHWGYMLLKSKNPLCREVIDLYLQTHKYLPMSAYISALGKWLKRGFTTVNKARRRVEDEIR